MLAMKVEDTLQREWDASKESNDLSETAGGERASEAALSALLECGGDDGERRAARLATHAARLEAANVGGMLAAATEGGGAALAARLAAARGAADALAARLARAEALARGAPDAVHARGGAARADLNARALLQQLHELFAWLDAPPLRDLDALPEIPLTSAEGRARALAAGDALADALQEERAAPPHLRRLAAVSERLRRLARARDALAAALARHVNNVLVHLGNDSAGGGGRAARAHRELQPLAPLMRCLRRLDARAHAALAHVYAAWRARALEREARAACDAARAALGAGVAPDAAERLLDGALALVEALAGAEQRFCAEWFSLAEAGGAEERRLAAALLAGLEAPLLALMQAVERHDPYGAFRVFACVGRRALEGAGGGVAEGGAAEGSVAEAEAAEGGARWARVALAGAAVAAKRQADRAVQEWLAALPEGARAAARRPKCGVLPFVEQLEELCAACERMAWGGRRADLERWYGALAAGAVRAVAAAEHPRTPRAVLLLENYHRLHAALAALRVPALEAARRDCRARYDRALQAYVGQHFGRPLEKLTAFFEGVAEAVALGCREDEVCYRAAFSKHELRRVLALYPAEELVRALRRLHRAVHKHLSADGALLQVVWRAMQQRFVEQYEALAARIAACYPAAGLRLPLTTPQLLDAFSDIAREH